ncbi:hypothetical protein PG996_003424 [Apiospora saccharicola]|uniref:DUF6604 domain-containing protein n=1 Tax=Apiospora saccharicola TaxID=335842 RepID=A0ABR1W526_9PEZI
MSAKLSPPGELLATYRQYKKDTESIAGWLAENATKRGFKLGNTPKPGNTSTTSGRLKGKARKQARNDKEAGVKHPKHTVKVSEFVSLAEFIASLATKPDIPQALGNLFERAVKARRECTEWYKKHGHDALSDKRHEHFTSILVDAWNTLLPFQTVNKTERRTESKARPEKNKRKEVNTTLPFLNRFSGLQVEDTTADEPTAPESQQDFDSDASFELPGITPATIEKDEEEIEVDFFFAIHDFLNDINKLRRGMKQLWSEYTSEEMELSVVSLLTNVTIHLVRRAEQTLDLCVQRPAKYPASEFPVWTFPALFMRMQHQDDPQVQELSLRDFVMPSTWIMSWECEHADFCMWTVYNAVKHRVSELEDSVKIQSNREVSAGQTPLWLLAYHESEDLGSKMYQRIQKMLAAFQVTSVRFKDSFAQDEITRGIFEIFRSGTLPVWAIFGIQTLLDTQDILHEAKSKQPLEELQLHTRNMLKTMDLYEHGDNPFGKDAKDHSCTKHVRETSLKEIKELVLEDGFRHRVHRMLLEDGFIEEEIAIRDNMQEEYHFLKRHPLRCGLLKYFLYFRVHCAGVCFEEYWSGLNSLIHVYAACRRLHPDDPVWPDMEFFLHNQDVNHLFVGGLPKSDGEALRKIVLAFGYRDTARNRPPKDVPKVRKVSDPNPMQSILADWAWGDGDAENWLLGLMAVIFDQKCVKERARRIGLSAADADYYIAEWTTGADSSQILHFMSFYLLTDADLYFDWHQLHAFAEKIWTDTVAGEHIHDAPVAAYEALAKAKDNKKPHLLNKAWRSIKKLCAAGQGDKCIAGIVERTKGSLYPAMHVAEQLDTLYRNWPRERLEESSAYLSLTGMMAEAEGTDGGGEPDGGDDTNGGKDTGSGSGENAI